MKVEMKKEMRVRMTPEEYRNQVLKLAEGSEDIKTLLRLTYQLKEYSSEEALARNFSALRGGDCRMLLRALRRKKVLGRGPFDEYICRPGYETVFDEVASGFVPMPQPLSGYLDAMIKAGDKAAIKMIELLLKVSIHGIPGYTQYWLIEKEISEWFSSSVFHTLEQKFIADNLCIYGQKRGHEFLWMYNQKEDELMRAREMLLEIREKELFQMPIVKRVEDVIMALIGISKRESKEWKDIAATLAEMPEGDIEKLSGYFSGFKMNEEFLFITGDMLIDRNSLYLVITDTLSRYDVREWRNDPVVFIISELPAWIDKTRQVFNDAYPKLSDRKIAIALPDGVAYTNYRQNLLSIFLERIGIDEVRAL
ncbi:hypothetical protein DRN80_01090 [Methanosarcinales archaeon]|nr:MAG: hypothetical protein DRN80_01090 [Methanosarcinales archaeon]